MDYFLFLFQFFCDLQKISQSRQHKFGGNIEKNFFNLPHSFSLSLSGSLSTAKIKHHSTKKSIGGRIELGIESKIVLIAKTQSSKLTLFNTYSHPPQQLVKYFFWGFK